MIDSAICFFFLKKKNQNSLKNMIKTTSTIILNVHEILVWK